MHLVTLKLGQCVWDMNERVSNDKDKVQETVQNTRITDSNNKELTEKQSTK